MIVKKNKGIRDGKGERHARDMGGKGKSYGL